jgi:Holliday junction resolvase RusA-like endonuclease
MRRPLPLELKPPHKQRCPIALPIGLSHFSAGYPMLKLKLDGDIVPKARARVTANGTYMPHNYQNWKRHAIASLRTQAQNANGLKGVAIAIVLKGKHSRRGDLDNISGSILDALVQAGILQNDNLICVHSLSVRLEYSKKMEPIALIEILEVAAEKAIAA